MNKPADFIEFKLKKSEEAFEDAVLLADHNRWNAAVNRLYYSVFYSAEALLLKSGFQTKTHSGVKTLLYQHFVQTGKLTVETGAWYAQLFTYRQDGDYGDFLMLEEEDVVPLLSAAKTFNAAMHDLITRI